MQRTVDDLNRGHTVDILHRRANGSGVGVRVGLRMVPCPRERAALWPHIEDGTGGA
jgi:hypothetical protein